MSDIQEMAAVAGLSFSELKAYPEVACLLGAKALKAENDELAERLFASLGVEMLPGPLNPWEGPAGEFWREAFKKDPKKWLVASIGSLPKEEAKECARALLISSAQNGAFECFEYLLSLGAARRSWKILQSAYLNGGWRAAEKVKKPTAKEAALLMSYGTASWRHRDCRHSTDGLMWLSKFLDDSFEQPKNWISELALTQSPEVSLFCVQNNRSLKAEIKKTDALALACALAAAKAPEAVIWLVDHFNLDANKASQGMQSLSIPITTPKSYHYAVQLAFGPITLLEAALIGRNADCAQALMKRGASAPSKERLKTLWATVIAANHWARQHCENMPGSSESLRETLELEASLSGPATVSRRSHGL